MKENLVYFSPKWQAILAANQLQAFEDFWALDIPAVDEGNYGRGTAGWSRVCIHRLTTETGETRRIIIKRQSNYRSRTLSHPLRGIPTFVKEFDFIRCYDELDIPALKPVYCATRREGNELQAILVTEYLEGYRSLEEILDEWQQAEVPGQQRATVIRSVAQLVARLHRQGLEHRCLFPKHIFVPKDLQTAPSCLIDLEKTRRKPWSFGRQVRDLAALARRSPSVGTKDQLLFLQTYLGVDSLDAEGKQLWAKIRQRAKKKQG